MQSKNYIARFNAVCQYFPTPIAPALLSLNENLKATAQEIRLRAGLPLAITVGGTQLFLNTNGSPTYLVKPNCILVEQSALQNVFKNLCNHSVYAHQQELCEGYLMLPAGHRAGICGTFVSENGNISTVRDISSLNIRIAKEVTNCSAPVFLNYSGQSILICGGPGSGKTTLLRDMVRRLANGNFGRHYRVSVIDSRGELAAVFGGVPTVDLGQTCDIIAGCTKGRGIEIALRTQFPEVIAFDELANSEEVEKVGQSLSAGAAVLTTAHAGSLKEMKRRKPIMQLLETGAVERVIFCKPGFAYQEFSVTELLNSNLYSAV